MPDKPTEVNSDIVGMNAAIQLGIETPMGKEYLCQVMRNAVLFEKKNLDYGTGNISAFGEKGIIVRVNDKVQRLKNLVFDNASKVNNEPVSDTWDDIANYGIIGKLCNLGIWK